MPDTKTNPQGSGKNMNKTTFDALQSMIQQLFESAVNNVQDVINETEDIEFFDCDKLIREADYIDNLQRVKNQLDDAGENDEIGELEEFEVNLKFLKGDFPKEDLYEMVDEGEVDVIWNMIYQVIKKRKSQKS